MSILIKGMEMPTSCHECVAGYGGCCYVAPADADGICPDHGRADFCPLVPVPDHGRLIDADAVMEKLQKQRWNYQMLDDSQTADKIMHGLFRAEQTINEAPTIIHANPPKEGKG